MAIKLDGKALAEKMRAQIREETESLARRPTLADDFGGGGSGLTGVWCAIRKRTASSAAS